MTSLRGNLDAFELTTIFQLLETEKKTGLLTIRGDEKTVRVFIRDGYIAYATDGQDDTRLGNFLRNLGKLSKEQLDTYLKLGAETKQSLAKVLFDESLITSKTLREYVQNKTENIVYDLFFWKAGDFEYKDVELNPKHVLLVELNILQILLEGSRRVDEMESLIKVIGGDHVVFKKPFAVKDPAGGLTNRERDILYLISDGYSLRKIKDKSGYDQYSVYKALSNLLGSGFIEPQGESGSGKPSDDAAERSDDFESKPSMDEPEHMRSRLLLSSREKSVLIKTSGKFRPVGLSSYEARFYNSLVGKQMDHCAVMAFVGSGGMGGVFQCWDMNLKQDVAMKVMSGEPAAQPNFRDMFIKKARKLSFLEHPGIARVYHVGNWHDIFYYTMEFIDGYTLSALLKKQQRIDTPRCMVYMTTICHVLDFAGRKDIIDWKINPQNIMINKDGNLKLTDFGMTETYDMCSPSKLQEAAAYMPPECMDQKRPDHRSQIYSLGATFYHLLTGHPPFEGDSIRDILNQHQRRALTPLWEKNPDVPVGVGKVIEKMMAKDPGNRYPDYQSVMNTLNDSRICNGSEPSS